VNQEAGVNEERGHVAAVEKEKESIRQEGMWRWWRNQGNIVKVGGGDGEKRIVMDGVGRSELGF
jgi:hypothetical protein